MTGKKQTGVKKRGRFNRIVEETERMKNGGGVENGDGEWRKESGE